MKSLTEIIINHCKSITKSITSTQMYEIVIAQRPETSIASVRDSMSRCGRAGYLKVVGQTHTGRNYAAQYVTGETPYGKDKEEYVRQCKEEEKKSKHLAMSEKW